MSDEASIRLENLKRLRMATGELKERLGRSAGFWSDLLRGNKSFGEKLARSIEDGLGIPRGWLDSAHGTDAMPAPEGTPPQPTTIPIEAAIDVLARALDGLNDPAREAVAVALVTMARAPDSQRARAALLTALEGGSDQPLIAAAAAPLSGYALDLAKQIDAIPPGEARSRAHAAASLAVSIHETKLAIGTATAGPPPAPAPQPGAHSRKSR